MKNILSESTKVASYLLWEKTRHNSALDLWYCCENIALYLEQNDIISIIKLEEIIKKNKSAYEYINFVSNISFRIYLVSRDRSSLENWYVAESLLNDYEWCRAIVNMAYVYRATREGKIETTVRSEWIRRELEKK